MANRDGERIGGVEGIELLSGPKQRVHHHLHLLLLGAAIPDYADLDFKWRIFADRQTGLCRDQQSYPTNVSELESGLGIDGVENLLDRDYLRSEILKGCA